METRVAVIAVVVEKEEAAGKVNELLHETRDYIIGRMGIPYRSRKINLISIAIDAPQPVIAQLSGRLGQLDGVSAKTAYSNVTSQVSEEGVRRKGTC